jgi:hypothetical protein
MHRTIDLDDHPLTVTSVPLRIEVPSPSAGFRSDCLSHRLGDTVPSTQPREVDLAQGLSTLPDVSECMP